MWEEEEEKEARRGVVTSAITLSSKRRRSSLPFLLPRKQPIRLVREGGEEVSR